jgi:hypothetical protein
VLGLGDDEHARTCEPSVRAAFEQTVGELLGRERGDVDPFRGRIELGAFDQIGRRRDEHRRTGIDTAREVVDFAFHSAGTTAIFEGSPFARRFRDMHTLLAQGQAHLSNFESAGQALFGIEPSQRL